jgi:hypothetical protein
MSRESGLTVQQFDEIMHRQTPKSSVQSAAQKARGLQNHNRSQMNATEALYELQLMALRASGVIEWYEFQCWRFKVGKDDNGTDAWYTPDFGLMYSDGRLEAVDVKGWGPIQEASLVRIKAVAMRYPIQFVIAQKQRNGEFERHEL